MLKVIRLDEYNVYVTDEFYSSHMVDVDHGALFISERITNIPHTIYAPGTWLNVKYYPE